MLHLNCVNFTSIANIIRVDNEEEDYGFKNVLAEVAKNECHQKNLRAGKNEKLGGGNVEYDQPDEAYDDTHKHIHYLVEFVYG